MLSPCSHYFRRHHNQPPLLKFKYLLVSTLSVYQSFDLHSTTYSKTTSVCIITTIEHISWAVLEGFVTGSRPNTQHNYLLHIAAGSNTQHIFFTMRLAVTHSIIFFANGIFKDVVAGSSTQPMLCCPFLVSINQPLSTVSFLC